MHKMQKANIPSYLIYVSQREASAYIFVYNKLYPKVHVPLLVFCFHHFLNFPRPYLDQKVKVKIE